MAWLKSLSLLVCTLLLACHGAVWTEEDEARALQQGQGRLNNVTPDAQEEGRAGDQGRDEVLGRPQGQVRFPQDSRDLGDSNPQLVSLRQQEDTISIDSSSQYGGGHGEQRSRSRLYSQQTQYEGSFPQNGAEFQKYEGHFPQNGAEFQQHGAEFQKHEGRFLQNGAEFQKPKGHFLQNSAEFQKYEGHFPQNGAEFQKYEGRFPQNDAEFQKYEGRFPQNDAEFQKYEGRFPQNSDEFQKNEGLFLQNGGKFQKYGGRFPQNGAKFQQYEGRFLQNGEKFQQYEGLYPQYGGRPEGGSTEFSQYESRTQDTAAETRTRYEDSQRIYESRYNDLQGVSETPYVDSRGEYETHYEDLQGGYEDSSQLDLRGNVDVSQFDGRTQDDASKVHKDSADAQPDGRAQESISNQNKIQLDENVESTDTDLADERRISFDFLESRNAFEPKKLEPECLSCHIFDEKKPGEQEVDNREAAVETGYLQDTFNYVSGIFQGEKQAPAPAEYFSRNPEPINPKFGAADFNGRTFERNQDGLRPHGEYRSSVNPDFIARPKSSPSGFVKQEYSSEFRSQTHQGFNGRPVEFPASNYPQDLDGSEEYSTGFESQAQHDGRQRFSGSVSQTQYNAPITGFEHSTSEHESQDLRASTNSRFGSQIDDASEDGRIDSFDSEEKYLQYRLQQLGYHKDDLISVANNPTSADANFNGQTQGYSNKEFGQNQPVDASAVGNERFGSQQDSTEPVRGDLHLEQNPHGRTEVDAQSEYLEYRQEQQPYDGLGLGQKVQSQQYENFRFGEQNQGDAQLEYPKYRQEQRQYDSQFFDKPVQGVQSDLGKGSEFENNRFGVQDILDIYHPEEAEQLDYLDGSKAGSGYRAATNTRFGSTDQSGFGASRGFGEEYPSASTGFESSTLHQVEYSRTQHSFAGLSPQAANFGQESRRFGAFRQDWYEAPPQKTEAQLAFEARRLEFELAFEAEEARRQAALEAEEAKLQAAKEAFESEINRLRRLGCSSCHLVLEDAAVHEGNTQLLDLEKKEKKPLKVSKLMDLEDESVAAPRSVKSPRDGCVTCHLIQPPSPQPAPILEAAQRAGHLKVPILVEVDNAGKTTPLLKQDPSGVLDLRKAASFRSSTFMETTVDKPFIPRSGPAPSRRGPTGSDSRRGASGNERPFSADSRRLTAAAVRPKIRGCRSCHVLQ